MMNKTPTRSHDATGDYQIVMIDPPWPKKKGGLRASRPNQGRSLDYKTMPVPDIFELLDREVFANCEETHAVFLWSIDQFLIESEGMMEARGYRRHARFIWDKTNGVAPAFTVRYSHEYLTWFYKPRMIPIDRSARGVFKTTFQEAARQHSRKPDAAYLMIDTLYPESRRLDVFSREPRPNWEQYGDQVDHFCGKGKNLANKGEVDEGASVLRRRRRCRNPGPARGEQWPQ